MDRPEDRYLLRVLRGVVVCFSRIYHRLEVMERCRMPREGAGILVSNHTSGLDPVLIQSVCPRLISWMMAREYYEMAALKWLFEAIRAIPVDRSGKDTTATRAALRALKGGAILGIFPEGKIETTRKLLPFQTGIALLAIRTGVPVYPVYLDGTQRGRGIVRAMLLRNRATIRFGTPLCFAQRRTGREELEKVTAEIQTAIEELANDR